MAMTFEEFWKPYHGKRCDGGYIPKDPSLVAMIDAVNTDLESAARDSWHARDPQLAAAHARIAELEAAGKWFRGQLWDCDEWESYCDEDQELEKLEGKHCAVLDGPDPAKGENDANGQ